MDPDSSFSVTDVHHIAVGRISIAENRIPVVNTQRIIHEIQSSEQKVFFGVLPFIDSHQTNHIIAEGIQKSTLTLCSSHCKEQIPFDAIRPVQHFLKGQQIIRRQASPIPLYLLRRIKTDHPSFVCTQEQQLHTPLIPSHQKVADLFCQMILCRLPVLHLLLLCVIAV